MTGEFFMVACHTGNGGPAHGFVADGLGVPTLEDAVAAAKADYLTSVRPGADVAFHVYRHADGHALIEVQERAGGPMRVAGLYKVLACEAGG